MKHKLLADDGGRRTYALVFAAGDELVSGLKQFAQAQHLGASHFSGIGAFEKATLGYFDWDKKQYLHNLLNEQVELLSILGDIALGEQGPIVHAHVVVGTRDGSTRGGHLIEGHVRPTLEMFLTEGPGQLWKKHDPQSGLALINLP
jgi:predicted DNA-binding protein with PD1-like motif